VSTHAPKYCPGFDPDGDTRAVQGGYGTPFARPRGMPTLSCCLLAGPGTTLGDHHALAYALRLRPPEPACEADERWRIAVSSEDVLVMFAPLGYRPSMTDPASRLTPADPCDLADALAFALRFEGRKRAHKADEIMSEIVAKRLVEHLERAGFVVMKRPAIIGGAALGRGFED